MSCTTPDVAPPLRALLDLTGRTVAVAGGGSIAAGWSIGRASCITYARQGATVCVIDRDLDSAKETVRLIEAEGGSAFAYQADMAREEDIFGLQRHGCQAPGHRRAPSQRGHRQDGRTAGNQRRGPGPHSQREREKPHAELPGRAAGDGAARLRHDHLDRIGCGTALSRLSASGLLHDQGRRDPDDAHDCAAICAARNSGQHGRAWPDRYAARERQCRTYVLRQPRRGQGCGRGRCRCNAWGLRGRWRTSAPSWLRMPPATSRARKSSPTAA